MAWAIANFQIRALQGVNGLALNGWLALFAVPQLLLASLALEHGQWAALTHATWRGYGAAAFMAGVAPLGGDRPWDPLGRK